jgi:lipopolysaccharide exporter
METPEFFEIPEKKKPNQSEFALDVFKLAGGTAFVQVLVLLVSPIIARLFAPKDFGLSANFTSIISILSVIACLKYESTIMLPKNKEDAANQLGLSVAVTVFISFFSFFVLWLFKGMILDWLNAPELLPYLWLVPVSTFFAGIFRALNNWNSRTRKYLRLSAAQATRSITENGSKIFIGLMGYASGGSMITTGVFGQAVSLIILSAQILKDDFQLFLDSIRPKKMLSGAKRYIKFPIFNTWTALLNQVSQQLPTFLLSAYFSTTEAGYYNMGYKLLRLPISLIGDSIAQVFYQRASKAHHEGTLGKLVESTSHQLIMLGLFPMILLSLTGREVFIFAFGERWAEAGLYTQILSIWTFFVLISNPMSGLFSILEKNEFGLFFSIGLTVSRVASLAIGGIYHNATLGLYLYSITGSLAYLYMQFALSKFAGFPIHRAVWQIISNLLFSAPFLGVVFLGKLITKNNPLLVTIICGIVCIFYYFILYKKDESIREVVAGILQRINIQSKFLLKN